MSSGLSEKEYRAGALERMREAALLFDDEMFAGVVYLAGRAVEGMLRALLWKHDLELRSGRRTLAVGHNLREILLLVGDLGVLPDGKDRETLASNVQYVGRLWLNNMRFYPTKKVETHWWKLGEVRRKRTLKKAVAEYYEACSAITKQCEALCVG